jgi:hypothetical protein
VRAAKEVATIDHISGGRFCLNLVAGWNEKEIAMFGAPQRDHDDRYAVAEDWITLCKELWTREGEFDHDGPFFKVPGAYSEPKPVQRGGPVLMSAGNSPRGQHFAARHTDLNFVVARDVEGAGRAAQSALLDFQHGARVTIDCSSLTVDALYSAASPTVVGPQIECFAGIVYGSLGSQLNTLTNAQQSFDAPSGFFGSPASIPDFGSEVKIYSDDPAATFDVILGRNVVAGRVTPEAVVTVGPNVWVQIPNGAEFIDLRAASGAATVAGAQYLLNL